MAQLHQFPEMFGWRRQCFIWFFLFQIVAASTESTSEMIGFTTEEALVTDFLENQQNCTAPAMNSFPSDGLDGHQRIQGWIIIHFLILLYITGAVAIVCDNYFVPVMQQFSETLKLPNDIAGATFMSFGTSCPELFVAFIGAFITEGNIGVGAVIGSAAFNVLALVSVCGICAGSAVMINWRPLTRDCIVYLIAVGSLICVIKDGKVYWYEGVILVGEYVAYILIIYLNARFQEHCRGPKVDYDFPNVEKDSGLKHCDSYCTVISTISQEFNDLQVNTVKVDIDRLKNSAEKVVEIMMPSIEMKEIKEVSKEDKLSDVASIDSVKEDIPSVIWTFPEGEGWLAKIMWILWWPVRFIYYLTIPNVREDHFSILTILTFFMSVAYIGALTYSATWMVSIIGYTIHIPDSVVGLTIMAIGNSLPEIISSIIVSRQGLCNMALSNAMGGNLFALLFCLAIPWIAKPLISQTGYVVIHGSGLIYSALILFVAVVVMLSVIAAFRFRLNKKIGILFLLLYVVYLTLSCLHELNYFAEVNLPVCRNE